MTAQRPLYIQMHPADNVAIIANDGGLAQGTAFPCGLHLVTRVPQGHKVALANISEGGEVRRYDVVIGRALRAAPGNKNAAAVLRRDQKQRCRCSGGGGGLPAGNQAKADQAGSEQDSRGRFRNPGHGELALEEER